jgi:uncharacterized protein
MITRELTRYLRRTFALDWGDIHGAPHWARMRENGLRLAESTGADCAVIELFAFLHDARRENDGYDPEHGVRAAALAAELRGQYFDLGDAQFEWLTLACHGHSDGLITGADVTVLTCWHANRLDLGRVGKRPDPRRLCTDAARDVEIISWAYARSIR